MESSSRREYESPGTLVPGDLVIFIRAAISSAELIKEGTVE